MISGASALFSCFGLAFVVSCTCVLVCFRSDVELGCLAVNLRCVFCRSRDWHEEALAAAKAEGLREKLGRVCASHECQGKVSPFFSNKFGINPE